MARNMLYTVIVNGRRTLRFESETDAHRAADAHQEMRPDARVIVREED